MTERVNQHRFATRAVHAGQEPDAATGAVNTPVFASATFVMDEPGPGTRGYVYGRVGNPTRTAYEECVSALEGGAPAALRSPPVSRRRRRCWIPLRRAVT